MRYKEDTTPPVASYGISGDTLLWYVIYGLILGIGMLIVGLRAKQIWLAFWGGVLALGSAGYLLAAATGMT